VFHALDRHYPEARVLVVGYPHLFSTRHASIFPSSCTAILRRISADERRGIRDATTAFNDMIREVAHAEELEFVSVEGVWHGYEPCGAGGQLSNSAQVLSPSGSFHPNADGQKAIAYAIATYLEDHPEASQPEG
jgi:lysophospholipase L1-like esterase